MEKTILSNYHHIAKPSKQSLPALINTNTKEVPDILRDFKYPISSWPIIISKKEVDDLIECCTLIPKLLQDIPELYFRNDIEKIANFYFEGDQTMAQFAILCNQKKVDVSCRLDLIKSSLGFKVLEVNAGSSIGGMEFQNFEPIISAMHPELKDEKLEVRKTQQVYIDFIIQKAIQHLSNDEDEITIFMAEMIFSDNDLIAFSEVEKFYNEILTKEIGKHNKKGKVVINKMSSVSLQNGKLMYNDDRVHAVLVSNFALKEITPDVFRAFMMNSIYFPDHIGIRMLRDKRNLAILRKLAAAGKFSKEENEKIQKFIPWSVLIEETTVSYKGNSYNLKDLLYERKDDLVIKVFDGLQGNDVFIGKSLSLNEWSEAIKKMTDYKKYVVQEFVISNYPLAPNKKNQWMPHSLVWGAFSFGETYGGIWVRMSSLENNIDVLNSANGAVEAIVYEETQNNHKALIQKEKKEITILGDSYQDFIVNTSKNIPVLIDPMSEGLPNLLKGYAYPVSSWPVIIKRDQINDLEELCVKIPKLIQKIPELYFKNDHKKIANFYFNGDEMTAQFALLCHERNMEIGCRLDLTLTEEDFKILEVNVGSSIGGWQIQSFEPIIKKYHPKLNRDFESFNTQKHYIHFLISNTIKQVSLLDKINIFLGFGELEDNNVKANITHFFNELLNKELVNKKYRGEAFVGVFSDLSLENGNLTFEGNKIDAVLAIKLDLKGMPPDVFRAFMMKKIYFPDHLATDIYGDKRNLGLLRKLAEQQQFTKEENELIFRSIPWTEEMKDTTCMYKGVVYQLANLLREQKNDFVIKAAQGFQGKDVFIGKYTTVEEWEEAISIGLANKDFIAQEFVDSKSFIAPNKENQWVPHKLIWGAFGFGEKYGGVWVRMIESTANSGVINSATGAVEAIVYEQLFYETLII